MQVLSLRQKHTQQQKIVNKLIQFLVALVQPRMGGAEASLMASLINKLDPAGAMKRRYPSVPGHQLAIEEGTSSGESRSKQPRLSEGGPVIQEMEEQDISNMTGSQLHDFLNISEGSVTTPVETEPPIIVQSSRTLQTPSPVKQETVSSSQSSSSSNGGSQSQQGSKNCLVDPANISPSLLEKIVKSEGLKRPVLHRLI